MPFLLLKLPDVGQLFLRLFPTGYDQAGHLRLMMTIREMKRKWEAEQDLDKMDHEKEVLAKTHAYVPMFIGLVCDISIDLCCISIGLF